MHLKGLLFFFMLCISIAASARFKAEDFKIDLVHADRTADLSRLYPPETLKKIARFYHSSPAGKAAFAKLAEQAAAILNNGDFPASGNYSDYIFRVSLISPGMVYFLSGHQELGRFIHDKTMDVVQRPLSFWLHAERFPMHKAHPVASLQTGDMLSRLVPGIDLASELFSEKEKKEIKEAIRVKGIEPCMLFTRKKNMNNWMAVISSGGYIAAKYTGDSDALRELGTTIKKYLDSCFENDGSYGEGQQYLLYPVGRLAFAASVMSRAERQEYFERSSLARSGEYLPYATFFTDTGKNAMRIQFRDGQQFTRPDVFGTYAIALICRSGYARAFMEIMKEPQPFHNFYYTLLASSCDSLPEPKSLDTLPKLRVFDNGECYIRSSWKAGAILFGMLSGGSNKTGFSHDRPTRNGIAFGAFGEYLIANPGHSSYSGKTYLENDSSTHGNNCVSINRKNQLFPRKKSELDNFGIPKAKVILAESGKDCDIIISDAAECYAEKPAFALRAAVFVRSPGYMVIFDRIGGNSRHQFDSYWHLNNVDGKSELRSIGTNSWLLERPRASLRIFARSDNPLKTEIIPGIMHRSYTYKADSKDAGKPGSSKVIQLSSPPDTEEWNTATVLFPEKSGIPPTPVSVSGNGGMVDVIIGNQHDRIEFKAGKIITNLKTRSY